MLPAVPFRTDAMSQNALDDTMYEFKENDEKAQAINDIDDFERRLAGGTQPEQRSAVPGMPRKKVCACSSPVEWFNASL